MTGKIALLLATCFGAGFAPRAPGTAGSLVALPVFLLLRWSPGIVMAVVIIGLCAIGVWAAQRVSDALGVEDPQIVVIDELVGAMIAMAIGGGDGYWQPVLALALFRLFDIWKPWPIAPLERLSPAGVGIMADDVAAGLVAGVIVAAIRLAWTRA